MPIEQNNSNVKEKEKVKVNKKKKENTHTTYDLFSVCVIFFFTSKYIFVFQDIFDCQHIF